MNLLPTQITIGCGEEHDIWADLQLAVDPVPRCLATPLASISGRIVSAESIDRIEHAVNGGAPVVDCTACGVSPAFAFSETLVPGVNEIKVSATDVLGHAGIRSLRSGVESDICDADRRAQIIDD